MRKDDGKMGLITRGQHTHIHTLMHAKQYMHKHSRARGFTGETGKPKHGVGRLLRGGGLDLQESLDSNQNKYLDTDVHNRNV